MLWQVRAVVQDRPGAVAALAASLGAAEVNILALEIFPTGGGCVVDELVLSSPDGWSAAEVEALCAAAGVVCVVVRRATTRVLEDQPVRWLRAAQLLTAEPHRLEEQLCALLGAAVAAPTAEAGLELTQGRGPVVRLVRDIAFTDTELGRATELRRLAATASRSAPAPAPGLPAGRPAEARHPRARAAEVNLRRGAASDAEALVAMHERCSAEVLLRRYGAPVGRLTPRDARDLLEPVDGRSVVVLEGDDVVAAGLVAREGDRATLALHVQDDRQRRGTGARLLRALAAEAAALGWEEVTCVGRPGDTAVLATVRRAGLIALVSYVDGACHHRVPLTRLRDAARLVGSDRAEVDDLLAQPAGG